MKQKKIFIVPIIAFLLVGTILSGLFIMIERQAETENRLRYQYMAINQSAIMQDNVNFAMAKASTFRALICDNEGDLRFFDSIAKDLFQEVTEDSGVVLKNVAAAPNGIVTKVFPLGGNEALLGFDFMNPDMAGNAEAIAAYEKGELIVTNPFQLVQGGTGVAGRLPVFLNENGEKQFWGLVTITMDFHRLLESFRLKNLENMNIDYELWYSETDGSRVTLASSETLPSDPVTHSFSLYNLEWKLDLAPHGGWIDYMEFAVGIAVTLATALLISLLLLDKAKLHQANEMLERLAYLDGLTLCYSRHYINTILINQLTGQWNDPTTKYSAAIVDIDHFKYINDTFGHETGDRTIRAVAHVLIAHIRQHNGDCVIRHGGDEFLILVNDVSRERFQSKLQAILEDVRNIHFSDLPDIHITISIGGVYYTNSGQSRYYDMMREADKKLYEAKEKGRNQFCI